MKYLLLFLISASTFAADYDGASKRPETKNTKAASFVIYLDGVIQPGIYARQDLAKLAQIDLSQRRPGRLVKLVIEEEVITTWVVTSSAKSSSSSAKASSSSAKSSSTSSKSSVRSSSVSSSSRVATISFKRPTHRENGEAISAAEIKGYEVIKTPPGAISVVSIPPLPDPISWNLPWQVADSDKVEIRALAKDGLMSDYANVPFNKNN